MELNKHVEIIIYMIKHNEDTFEIQDVFYNMGIDVNESKYNFEEDVNEMCEMVSEYHINKALNKETLKRKFEGHLTQCDETYYERIKKYFDSKEELNKEYIKIKKQRKNTLKQQIKEILKKYVDKPQS